MLGRSALIFLLALSGLFFAAGCSNDMDAIREFTHLEREPTVIADTLRLKYTVNGRLNAEVFSPSMLSHDREYLTYDEFPRGIEVRAYNDSGRMKSMVRANYAIYQRNEKLWDARYNVVAVNEKGDSIQTEQIFWNEESGRVYTTANVRVRTATATLFGRGLESDDRFESWVIKEPTGVISVPKPGEDGGMVHDERVGVESPM